MAIIFKNHKDYLFVDLVISFVKLLTLENNRKVEISYMHENIHLIQFTMLEKWERDQMYKNKEMFKKLYFIEHYAYSN